MIPCPCQWRRVAAWRWGFSGAVAAWRWRRGCCCALHHKILLPSHPLILLAEERPLPPTDRACARKRGLPKVVELEITHIRRSSLCSEIEQLAKFEDPRC